MLVTRLGCLAQLALSLVCNRIGAHWSQGLVVWYSWHCQFYVIELGHVGHKVRLSGTAGIVISM